MQTLLVLFAVIYFIVGIIIYAITDTTKFARKLERSSFIVPYGVIQDNLFLFVLILWPVWLFINANTNESL